MYKRVLARRLAVQALYQWQMTALNVDDLLLEFDLERELGKADKSYFIEVITGVVQCFKELKSDLQNVLDRDWERIQVVERSILLIGALELREEKIPSTVVINESIELCKRFGTVDGFKYVNGVLDALKEVHDCPVSYGSFFLTFLVSIQRWSVRDIELFERREIK